MDSRSAKNKCASENKKKSKGMGSSPQLIFLYVCYPNLIILVTAVLFFAVRYLLEDVDDKFIHFELRMKESKNEGLSQLIYSCSFQGYLFGSKSFHRVYSLFYARFSFQVVCSNTVQKLSIYH